MAQAELKAANK